MIRQHFVEFFSKCPVHIKSEIKPVIARDPEKISVPKDAFAFRFFDRLTIGVNSVVPQSVNFSGVTYYGMEYTLEEMQALFIAKEVFIAEMKRMGCNRAVLTRSGTWHILSAEDKVI